MSGSALPAALGEVADVIIVENGVRPSPTVVVGRGSAPGPLSFGLDRPLELRGGDRLGPDRLPCELPLDWVPELVSVVAEACRGQVAAGRKWLAMPPVLLLGQTGCGRTHVARSVARHAGLPFVSIDVAGPSGAERLGRTGGAPFDAPLPPRPVLAMAATGCANPVVLLTGIDDATEETLGLIGAMIDPVSSSGFVDQRMRATIDLGHVNWFLASVTGHRLPPTLSCGVQSIQMPQFRWGSERELILLSVLAEVMHDLRLRPGFDGCDPPRIVARLLHDPRHQRRVADLYPALVEMLGQGKRP